MNMYFRPKIQNGPVAKRVRPAFSITPPPRSARPSPLATVTPLWSGVSVGELAQSGLAVFGLDERLQSTKATAKTTVKAAARSRVLLGLVGCGVLLAGGFLFSLRDHFIAHAFGHEEVKLKAKMDQAAAEHQQLEVQLNRAASPQEIERVARESAGLAPLELDQKKVVSGIRRQVNPKIAAAEKAKKELAAQPQGRTRNGKTKPAKN